MNNNKNSTYGRRPVLKTGTDIVENEEKNEITIPERNIFNFNIISVWQHKLTVVHALFTLCFSVVVVVHQSCRLFNAVDDINRFHLCVPFA